MKKMLSVLLLMSLLFASIAFAESATSQLQEMYAQAELLMISGDYGAAAGMFEGMRTYSDSWQKALYCRAIDAAESLNAYDMAIDAFKMLGDFKDSRQMVTYYEGRKNQAFADRLLEGDVTSITDEDLLTAQSSYADAKNKYEGIALFRDCLSRINECTSNNGKIANEQEDRKEPKYQEALAFESQGMFQSAISIYNTMVDYKDSANRIDECNKEINYRTAIALEYNKDFSKAIDIYRALGDYKDSKDRIVACEDVSGKTYTQYVIGFQPFTVEITLQDGKILSVEIPVHHETPGLGADLIGDNTLFRGLIGQDIETAQIDVKAGVTLTSNAINEALRNLAYQLK